VKIIAEADRGAHEDSLESLHRALAESEKAAQAGALKPALLTGEKLGLCDAFYQRLVHAEKYELARKAFEQLKEHARTPAIAEFLANRLKRLDLVGKPAPAIQGTDIDGKPFSLADAKGKPVLIVFWASWCLPNEAEIEGFKHLTESYRARGLQVVGINLDTLQENGQRLETVLPNIRHFLLDHNVSWPTLINGSGDKDFAKAYGVTEIPANVLIGKDGSVAGIDLVLKNLDSALSRVVGH
jgi:peroxiredoxin